MLVSIRNRAPTTEPTDAVEMLVACHARIRRFTELAARLGADEPEPELASAAAAVHRYFTIALPLHSSDEDQLVVPALTSAGVDDDVFAALAQMTGQHDDIHALIDRLAPRWDRLTGEPALAHTMADELELGARQLAKLFETHLSMEERIIFPALRRVLPAAELTALADAMRARRQ